MKTNKCYQCGFCCTISSCGYGEWDAENHRCRFLNEENKCAIYAKIVEKEKSVAFPMMGCGCSSPLFNEMRDSKMIALGLNPEDEAKAIEKEYGIELDISPDFANLWEKMME